LETETRAFVQKSGDTEASVKADAEKRLAIYRQAADSRARDLEDKAKKAEERAQESETRARIEEERAIAADQKARADAERARAESERAREQAREGLEEFQRRAKFDAANEAARVKDEMTKAAEA